MVIRQHVNQHQQWVTHKIMQNIMKTFHSTMKIRKYRRLSRNSLMLSPESKGGRQSKASLFVEHNSYTRQFKALRRSIWIIIFCEVTNTAIKKNKEWFKYFVKHKDEKWNKLAHTLAITLQPPAQYKLDSHLQPLTSQGVDKVLGSLVLGH